MTKFRKKPVVIEAVQLVPVEGGGLRFDNGDDGTPNWLTAAIRNGVVWCQGGSEPYATIKTLEGDHRANPNDWIIQGVKGELYPCKPDIFASTYEAVE